uniref:Putative secreted protein n=1 Tax=Anopheles marajoara TaxID=58244 RepID=A0A2M4CGC6_9DIPT
MVLPYRGVSVVCLSGTLLRSWSCALETRYLWPHDWTQSLRPNSYTSVHVFGVRNGVRCGGKQHKTNE